MANKKAKPNARHVDLYGVRFCLPKGARRIINRNSPHLAGKKPLNLNDTQKWLKKHKTELQ